MHPGPDPATPGVCPEPGEVPGDLVASASTPARAAGSVDPPMPSTPSTPAPAGRRYGGRTADERRGERREQLIEAGIELFGTVGYGATSIRAVLRESGLAERYFYESFDSLEALLVAVHEHIHEILSARVIEATEAAGTNVEARARAGLRAFVETVITDERWVRIKLQELGGSAGEEVRQFRRRAQARYATLLVAYGPLDAAIERGLQPQALALAVLAAVESLLDAWAAGELEITLDQLIEHAIVVITGTVTELERR